MTLDEFELGKAWLGQFSVLDQEIGRQMLRSLRLVSHTAFQKGINHEVTKLLDDLNGENAALFDIKETPREENLTPALEEQSPTKRVAGSSADLVRNMNENLFRVDGTRIQAHPTLSWMRSERIKNVVLVDDLIGSGKRISTYLRKEMEPTLKSWISYKWTKLWIVAYGGLDAGVQAVLRNGYGLTKDRIRLVTPSQQKSQYLTLQMQEFCKRNARRTGFPKRPMGFDDGGVAMIFEHSCPSNAPPVLWSPRRKFKPLFPNRGIPSELKPAFYADNVNHSAQILWDSSQYRLALALLLEPHRVRHQDSQWRLLLMLGLASRSRWEDVKIAGLLGISVTEVESKRFEALRIGLIDKVTHEITPLGRALLDKIRASASKTQKMRKRKQLSVETAYYPQSVCGLVRY
jgi:hypothetical protein